MASDVDVIKGIYASFFKGDMAGVLDALADDVDWAWYGPPVVPWAGSYQGKDGVGRFFGIVGSNISVEAYEPREFLAGDGTVTVLGWQRVVATPTGKAFETHFAHVFSLADGKVTRAREFYDSAAVAAAFTG